MKVFDRSLLKKPVALVYTGYLQVCEVVGHGGPHGGEALGPGGGWGRDKVSPSLIHRTAAPLGLSRDRLGLATFIAELWSQDNMKGGD